jgi:hypothetical protein
MSSGGDVDNSNDLVDVRRRARFWLRFGGHDLELTPGETLIGRSEGCQIVVNDPLVSRRHAVFIVDQDSVRLQELGSVNGVMLNGERMSGVAVLKSGDHVTVGKQEFELYAVLPDLVEPTPSRRKRMFTQTLNDPDVEKSDAIRQSNTLAMLGGIADKALAQGHGKEAERILKKPLEGVLAKAKAGGVPDDVAEQASTFAVRLAQATRDGKWVDYALELYTEQRAVLPSAVVDTLYAIVRSTPGVTLGVLRKYIEVLREHEATLSHAERFVVRRIDGLDALMIAG